MSLFRLWSDVHTEFGSLEYIKKEEDKDTILLLAGDIGVGTQAETFIEQLCKEFKSVVMICGNHEFYHYEYYSIIEKWRKIEEGLSNFHFLNNDVRYFDSVRIIGGTMWTNFNDANQIVMNYCRYRMNDYSDIKIIDGTKEDYFSPEYAYRLHCEFIGFLVDELEKEWDGPTIVMTHHSPADHKKLNKLYNNPKHNLINYAYYANIENLIKNNTIELWVHGHTHVSYDHKIGNTTVICNPRGYFGYRLNPEFDSDYIIELEK